jgi:hypothetical protein
MQERSTTSQGNWTTWLGNSQCDRLSSAIYSFL